MQGIIKVKRVLRWLDIVSKILITANVLCGLGYAIAGSYWVATLCFISAGFMFTEVKQ